MNKRLLFIKQVEEMTGRHRQTLWRYWVAGKFPKPVSVEGRNAWTEETIQNWIDSKMENAS